ncbi:hypothetical protein ACTPEF_23550 [Clostridioides difficile]
MIALSACLAGDVARALMNRNYEKAKQFALDYRDIFAFDIIIWNVCIYT